MILVVLIVLALVVDLDAEPKSLTLELVFKVERLDHLQGPRAVVVPHHGELVGTKPRALNNLEDVKNISVIRISNIVFFNGIYNLCTADQHVYFPLFAFASFCISGFFGEFTSNNYKVERGLLSPSFKKGLR